MCRSWTISPRSIAALWPCGAGSPACSTTRCANRNRTMCRQSIASRTCVCAAARVGAGHAADAAERLAPVLGGIVGNLFAGFGGRCRKGPGCRHSRLRWPNQPAVRWRPSRRSRIVPRGRTRRRSTCRNGTCRADECRCTITARLLRRRSSQSAWYHKDCLAAYLTGFLALWPVPGPARAMACVDGCNGW